MASSGLNADAAIYPGVTAMTLYHADCRDILPTLGVESIDAVITDPPYHLQSIHKRFAAKGPDETSERYAAGAYGRHAKGFMGKQWDGGDIARDPELWRLVFDVLKPGAHLAVFGGTRTFARMFCAIEDAGFECRDTLSWNYCSGFPKSHNLHGEWEGWGTALKPAWEPIGLFRKPLIGTVAANVMAHGTGAINVDVTRIPFVGEADEQETKGKNRHADFGSGPMTNRIFGEYKADRENYDPPGRWPANVLHDGSDEVEAAFAAFGDRSIGHTPAARGPGGIGTNGHKGQVGLEERFGPTGSASRFFLSAKADADDRVESKHPTVKPVALIRWLVRLITPPGGTVLDPFAGTGTTGVACLREGCKAVLIEREAEYHRDITRRLARFQGLDNPLFGAVAD